MVRGEVDRTVRITGDGVEFAEAGTAAMAAFDDGDLLIFALDEANRQPQLVQYSMIGQKFTTTLRMRSSRGRIQLADARGEGDESGPRRWNWRSCGRACRAQLAWKDAMWLQTSDRSSAAKDGDAEVKLPKVERIQAVVEDRRWHRGGRGGGQ